jgi:hypothetical protein
MNIVRIIKKNTSIIIPAAMAAVALLLLVPTVMIRGEISAKLEESVKLGREVTSSLRTAVSDKQYEVVRKLEDMHQTDTNEIENLAKQTSQRELFSYKIFPEPNETSVQIFNEFKKAYMTAFAKLTADMHALDAPTDVEIRKEAGSVEIPTDTYTRETMSGSPTENKSDKIVNLLCKRRSEEVPVYANPRAFSGYAVWDNWEYSGTENAVRGCWYSQLAYWIHKDIVDTINTMNSGSTSTTKSPVKRLLGVRFARSSATGAGADNGRELPVYVTDKSGGLCLPWTERKCNDQIDVVHFDLAVIVKADDALKFMEELCSEKEHSFAGYKGDLKPEKYKHNQITILQSSIEPVYRDSPEHKRYYYGQDAVVLMNLACEYVFNRQGYDIIKPKYIQNDITGTGAPIQQFQPGVPQPSGRTQGIEGSE